MLTLGKLIRKTYLMAQPGERKVIMHNAASLTVLQTITYLLPLIIIPYLFRVLGPNKFGLIAFAQAFIQYFIIVTDYGFNISATKEISIYRKDKAKVSDIFISVMLVKISLTILSLLILGCIVMFIPRFRDDWLVYLFSFGMVVGSTLFPMWFFQGIERMRYITVLNIIGGILFAPLVVAFVHGPEDYLKVPLINSAVYLLTGLLGQFVVFSRFPISLSFPGFGHFRRQVQAGWDIFLSIAAINAYTTTRIFILGLLTNNTITGIYSMAEKIANTCQTFPLDSFSRALFPRLSKIYHKNRTKAFRIMQHTQWITILVSLIFLPLVFVLAHPIVSIVCGGDFPKAVLALRLLLIGVFFVAANAFRVQFLLVCGRTRTYSKIHVTMALIGLPLLFILIKNFSYVGAAMATVFIEASIFTMTYLTVRKMKPV